MLRLREFISAKAELGHRRADLRRDGRVGREELVELQGILLMLLPELGAAGGVGGAPAVGFADESHREHLTDAVVRVELVSRQGVKIPGQRRVWVFLEIPADQFEACRVVGLRFRERYAVRRVLGQAEPEAVDHDGLFAGLVVARADGRDEWQRQAVGIETIDGHLLLRVLAARERFAVFVAALSTDVPDHAGAGHQVALIRGIDEDFRGVHAAGRPQADDPGASFLDAFQGLFRQHAHAGFLEHRVRHAGGDVRLVGPDGVVLHRDVVRELHPAGGVIGGDALVPFLEEAQQGGADGLVGIAEAQAAGVDAADVGGGFEEHDLRAFAGGGDRRAEAAGGRAVDDDVGLRSLGGTGEQQEP